MLQKRRNNAAAQRFFKRVLASCREVPGKIVTDQLRSYSAAKAEIPELANVKHVFVKALSGVTTPSFGTSLRLRDGTRASVLRVEPRVASRPSPASIPGATP